MGHRRLDRGAEPPPSRDVVTVRPVGPDDEAAVGHIAFQTGFFGQSAQLYFADQALFSDLWVGPYFRGGGFGSLVAEGPQGLLGYVLGSPSPQVYARALRRTLLRRVLPQVPQYVRSWPGVPYLWRAARYPSPHADWNRFPAHLHINLLPQARGLGLGRRLLRAHLDLLGAARIPGVQLSTTTENRAALGLYHALGFEVQATQVTPLWTPWLGHPAEHLVLGRVLES